MLCSVAIACEIINKIWIFKLGYNSYEAVLNEFQGPLCFFFYTSN